MNRMNQLLFFKNKCVIQIPKSGSNTIFYAHQKLNGNTIFYDLSPGYTIKKPLDYEPCDLIIHLRDPLDRFWAGLRQDYIDAKQYNLEKFVDWKISKLGHYLTKKIYEHNSLEHTKEQIVFRIKRILDMTKDWWRSVQLVRFEQMTNWLGEEWNFKEYVEKNKHSNKLKNQINSLRDKKKYDKQILDLEFIKKEYLLYEKIDQTFTIHDFKKFIGHIYFKN